MIDGKQYEVKRCAIKKISYKRNFNNGETSGVGDGFEEDYESGDLGSSDPDNSDKSGDKYPKFMK